VFVEVDPPLSTGALDSQSSENFEGSTIEPDPEPDPVGDPELDADVAASGETQTRIRSSPA